MSDASIQRSRLNSLVPSPEVLDETARLKDQFIWISDGDRDSYWYLSDNFDQLLGADRDLLLREPERWVKMIDDEPLEYGELFSGTDSVRHQFEFTNLEADRYVLSEEITRIDPTNGDETALLGIIEDITDQDERMNHLKRSTKFQTLGTMSSGIMHEINNPNASLQGNLDYSKRVVDRLQEELPEDVDEETLELLDDVGSALESSLEQSERIEALVNEVELFSKEAQFSQNPDLLTESTSLGHVEEILREQLDAPDRNFEVSSQPNVTLEINLENSPGDTSVPLSEKRFELIVQHLVQNSLDATRDRDNPSINIKVRINEQELILHIVDNGTGFEGKASELLDPFHTTKSDVERLGLGLSIIESIMQRIGGSLNLRSQDEMGTTALVRIPLDDA
jgi:signal transduction histidine kinase